MSIAGLVAVLTAVLAISGFWLNNALKCGVWGYKPGWFVGYCSNPKYGDYGDYDHGALFYGLETVAVNNAKQADVLIFGNSRTLFALPSDGTRPYFSKLGLSYFNLAFGHDERDHFPLRLAQKLELRPKLIIINVDPMFSGTMSHVGLNLIASPLDVWLRYRAKWLLNKSHKRICETAPWLCGSQQGPLGTFFRSEIDGGWGFYEVIPDSEGIPITEIKKQPMVISQETLAPFIDNARKFIDGLGFENKCVIFTGVPNSLVNSEEVALHIAKALNLFHAIPRISGLFTIDGSHFTTPSADRWREAFFNELQPILASCLASSRTKH